MQRLSQGKEWQMKLVLTPLGYMSMIHLIQERIDMYLARTLDTTEDSIQATA
jgi:hypothetical protein